MLPLTYIRNFPEHAKVPCISLETVDTHVLYLRPSAGCPYSVEALVIKRACTIGCPIKLEKKSLET